MDSFVTPDLRCVADRLVGQDSTTDRVICKSLEWTADGTCLISTLSNGQIQTIVVPVELLDELQRPHRLEVYCSIVFSESVRAVAAFPRFNLQDSITTVVLSSAKDVPIRLNSALSGNKLASYPLVDPMTEQFISPHSLCFTGDGTRFMTGSDSLISVFDVSRPGQEPIVACPTGPKRRRADMLHPSKSMRGIISALDLERSSNVLAAGTFSRHVGLYDAAGQGECIGAFSVVGNEADQAIGGQGITQVLWSPCGRYLYVAERKSDGVMVYDIRKTGQLLSWLQGRQAATNQRLSIDVYCDNEDSYEVWAGGIDGSLRKWVNAHHYEGPIALEWHGSVHAGKCRLHTRLHICNNVQVTFQIQMYTVLVV